jgi:hypothetical protein
VFQASAFEVGFEFALNILRQNRTLLGKACRELRIATFNDPVKQVVFGLLALIAIRTRFHVAASCRSSGEHALHPCETVVSYSLPPHSQANAKRDNDYGVNLESELATMMVLSFKLP